jgi:hypothetical protein
MAATKNSETSGNGSGKNSATEFRRPITAPEINRDLPFLICALIEETPRIHETMNEAMKAVNGRRATCF